MSPGAWSGPGGAIRHTRLESRRHGDKTAEGLAAVQRGLHSSICRRFSTTRSLRSRPAYTGRPYESGMRTGRTTMQRVVRFVVLAAMVTMAGCGGQSDPPEAADDATIPAAALPAIDASRMLADITTLASDEF